MQYNLTNFRHFRNCLSISILDAAKMIMHIMILSHKSYYVTCWRQAGETAIRPLESLYKQTLKNSVQKSHAFPSL